MDAAMLISVGSRGLGRISRVDDRERLDQGRPGGRGTGPGLPAPARRLATP
jgi:hypothetical protein